MRKILGYIDVRGGPRTRNADNERRGANRHSVCETMTMLSVDKRNLHGKGALAFQVPWAAWVATATLFLRRATGARSHWATMVKEREKLSPPSAEAMSKTKQDEKETRHSKQHEKNRHKSNEAQAKKQRH